MKQGLNVIDVILRKMICVMVFIVMGGIIISSVPVYSAKPETKESKEMKKKVRELLLEGRELFLEGKYDDAISKFTKVTELKPNHLGARIAIQTVLDEKTKLANLERENAVEKRMLDTERLIHEKKKDTLQKIMEKYRNRQQERQKTARRIELEKKLSKIIPEINFTNAHLRDVIQYLHNVGDVNIIIDEEIFESSNDGIIAQEPANEIPSEINVSENYKEVIEENENTGETIEQKQAPSVSENVGKVTDRVTISLQNIPLIEALKYILRTKKLRYRIDDYAVWISKDVSAPEMLTRSYKLLSGKLSINKLSFDKPKTEGEPSPGAKVDEVMNIKDMIQEIVPFPPESKIYLDERTNTLVITNTKENLDLVAELVEKLSVPPVQVEIEAKFVEINQEDADELGLEFFVADPNGIDFKGGDVQIDSDTTDPTYGRQYPNGNVGKAGKEGFTSGLRFLTETINNNTVPRGNILAVGGILNEEQFKMVLHALSQRKNTDVMNAPKVTTLNCHQAEIKLVTEFWYPQEFEAIPPVLSVAADGTTTEVAPAAVQASDFIRRDIGVLLNVTPDVGANRKTINLTLIPEVSKFVTWMDFGVEDAPQLVPVFASDNVATSVVISDGNTIVLGGTVRIEKTKQHDKIPVLGDIPYLGRAFRSETEEDTKINLLIFVTAHIITPGGNTLKEEMKTVSSEVDDKEIR